MFKRAGSLKKRLVSLLTFCIDGAASSYGVVLLIKGQRRLRKDKLAHEDKARSLVRIYDSLRNPRVALKPQLSSNRRRWVRASIDSSPASMPYRAASLEPKLARSGDFSAATVDLSLSGAAAGYMSRAKANPRSLSSVGEKVAAKGGSLIVLDGGKDLCEENRQSPAASDQERRNRSAQSFYGDPDSQGKSEMLRRKIGRIRVRRNVGGCLRCRSEARDTRKEATTALGILRRIGGAFKRFARRHREMRAEKSWADLSSSGVCNDLAISSRRSSRDNDKKKEADMLKDEAEKYRLRAQELERELEEVRKKMSLYE